MTEPFIAVLAELTHRCPLACGYCSNPVELTGRAAELDTETWAALFAEAAALGALQVSLSGGEPAARRDLEAIVEAATRAGLYTNLLTSGLLLDRDRLARLALVGLDHLQLSVQSTVPDRADRISGHAGALAHKATVAEAARALGLSLTVNCVLHRETIDEVPALVRLAEAWGASRIELAHVQLMGTAWANRHALVPSVDEVARAKDAVARARAETALVVDYVGSDVHADRPKACMGGLGELFLVVAPDGALLPCHGASALPLAFPRFPETSLEDAWRGPAFTRLRGPSALGATCRSCPEREVDHGGCRCQAFLAIGSLRGVDPACARSSAHEGFVRLRAQRRR